MSDSRALDAAIRALMKRAGCGEICEGSRCDCRGDVDAILRATFPAEVPQWFKDWWTAWTDEQDQPDSVRDRAYRALWAQIVGEG